MNGSNSVRTFRPELTPAFLQALGSDAVLTDGPPHRRNLPDIAEPLILDCAKASASDVHIEPHHNGTRVRVRVDGAVWDVAHLPLHAGRTLVNQFKALAGLDPIARFTPREAHASVPHNGTHLDLRLSLAPTLDRETLAIRLLDPSRLDRSITALGLSERNLRILSEWLDDITGMFLATGPTGSGKTTTLYALLRQLKEANRVVLTLEDPVEYQIDGITQIQVDELHGLDFAEGIKSLLRHDPDYMMLGEVRDDVSAHTAVNAAISGRVLLTTMHSRDAVGAITALRNWRLTDHGIAESVAVVLAQRLMRKICNECRFRRDPTEIEEQWFQGQEIEMPAHFWEGRGCSACRNLGYRGRTGVFELWRLKPSDYQMILRHADEHRLRMHLHNGGHSFLVHEAVAKLAEGVTTYSEVRRVAAGAFLGSTAEEETPPMIRL